VSFRPGYLSDPFGLPEALEGTQYRYSSSATANNSLTHLPFRLSYNRSSQGESSIFEFPVTVEDEAQPPMNERLDAALLLAKRIAAYGGIYVLLTHPNVTGEKLEFERQLVSELSGTAWFGSLDQFGGWWAARDSIRIQVTDSADLRTIGLNAPLPLDGLSLTVPAGWTLITPTGPDVVQTDQVIVIRHARGELLFKFRKS
jgi:hypothetical protein